MLLSIVKTANSYDIPKDEDKISLIRFQKILINFKILIMRLQAVFYIIIEVDSGKRFGFLFFFSVLDLITCGKINR